MHILDPEIHHAWLRYLEKDIVEISEFLHCRGDYDLSDHGIQLPSSNSLVYQAVPEFVKPLLLLQYDDALFEVESIRAMWRDLASLRKSYVIMSRVVAGFRHLRRASFCGSAFNILLQQPDSRIAKIVQIPETLLDEIQQGIQEALVQVFEHDLLPDEVYVQLLTHVEPPVCQLLDTLGLVHSPGVSRSSDSILELCRLASIFLDLGLVCYVGSHGRRFDVCFLDNDLPAIIVSNKHAESFTFSCKRSRLACLDNYLDKGEVWTFSCSTNGQTSPHQQIQSTERLLILTTIEDFADIWGPVWAVRSDQGAPSSIQYYQLARGVIYPDDLVKESQHKGAVRCHWTSSSDFQRRREMNVLWGGTWGSFTSDALLLIGATFRENSNCRYTLNDFEHAYGHKMTTLGTKRPGVELDTISGVLSVSKVIGISGQATAKLVPGISLKERILASWKHEPEHASSIIFHQYLAVEVSHCTGNARRTHLRNLFLMAPVQVLLERYCPNWSRRGWGPQFLRALHSQTPNDMIQVWRDYEKNRRELANMIVPVLEILGQTGTEGEEFNVAFFNSYQERYFTFQCRFNDWARILKDSYKHAVYAIISEKCLEAYTYTHSTARCENHNAFTVLHTHLGSDIGLSSAGSVEINLSGHFYREDKEESSSNITMMTSVPHFVSPFASIRNRFRETDVHESSPLRSKGPVYEVFIRASKVSSGGMARPRLRRQSLSDIQDSDPASLTVENHGFTWSQRSH